MNQPIESYRFLLASAFKHTNAKQMKTGSTKSYREGWNDCLKAIRKNQREMVKTLQQNADQSFDWRCLE